MALIEVNNLCKEYKVYEKKQKTDKLSNKIFGIGRKPVYVNAVENINFKIHRGETVGYIGANGAGKSTTIKMMTGILRPTAGNVQIAGFNPVKERIKCVQNIGAVFGQRSQLWWDLPAIDTYKMLKAIYNIPNNVYKSNLNSFINILGIEKIINIPVRHLSLGQRVQCDIVAAILHNPKIVFLDEPTIGLDVLVKERIRNFIKYINKTEKTTVLLTSHDLSDIKIICERIIIIDSGNILIDCTMKEFEKIYLRENTIKFNFDHSFGEIIKSDLLKLNGINSVIFPEDNLAEVRYDKYMIDSTYILKKIVGLSDIQNLKFCESKLDSVVKRLYERNNILYKEQ